MSSTFSKKSQEDVGEQTPFLKLNLSEVERLQCEQIVDVTLKSYYKAKLEKMFWESINE